MRTRLLLLIILMPFSLILKAQNLYLDNIQKAEQGDAEAQNNIGRCYALGIGVGKDTKQAMVWFKKSAAQGNTKGIINVGTCYQDDWKFEKARSYYEDALSKRDIRAYYFLGWLYASPLWQKGIDLAKSLSYFQQGAAAGDVRSQYQLSKDYNIGTTKLTRDGEKAQFWRDQVIANKDQRWAASAANDACYSFLGEGKIEEALRYADIAIEKTGGKEANYYDSKGDVYLFGLNRQNNYYKYKGDQYTDWYKNFDAVKAYEYYEGAKQMLAKCNEVNPDFFKKKNTQFYQNMQKQEYSSPEWLKDQEVLAALHAPSQATPSVAVAHPTARIEQHDVQQPRPASSQVAAVDINIPAAAQVDNHTFVVIIGNEKYEEEADVPFAENDARIFYEYCKKTLGISEKHIRLCINAGFNDIRKAVSWLKQGLTAYGGQGRGIFYYAGHGIPNEADKGAYLLPVDGIGSDIESAYSLTKLYQTLSELPAQRVSIFLDACFSGAKRDGQMMASARGVAIKAKPAEAKGKMVVFTAATGDETAYPFKSQRHGMFTYFLLRKLQETKGDVTLGDLSDYLKREVRRESFDENNKIQTPTVIPSQAFADSWRTMKLK